MISFIHLWSLVFLLVLSIGCSTPPSVVDQPKNQHSKEPLTSKLTKHENGNNASLTFFRSGKRDSIHKEWFPNGKLQVERTYNLGEVVQEKLFSIDGKILQNITIKDGRKYGLLFSSFCMNGVVKNPELDTIIFEAKN